MQFRGQTRPPLGVVFDSAMGDTIDDPLALALLYGLQAKGEARVIAVATSKPSLDSAAFCDVLVRFYTGAPGPFMVPPAIGMATVGKDAQDTPLLTAPLARPGYSRGIHQLDDTADPAALIRNVLTAQYDRNAVIVMTGAATNLAGLLALPGAKEIIAQKVSLLSIAAKAPWDPAAARKLFGEWPTQVVVSPKDVGDALPFPAASLDQDFAWAPEHPVVDAWRAAGPVPHDAPSWALTAALYAVRPQEGYFKLSEPGTVTVPDNGRPRFSPSAGGKHRTLIFDPAQKDRILQAYVELASTHPIPRRGRGRK
jgi:hypothetical protein